MGTYQSRRKAGAHRKVTRWETITDWFRDARPLARRTWQHTHDAYCTENRSAA